MRHTMKFRTIFTVLFLYTGIYGFTQHNISVPLEDPVYDMLEHAMLRGYCEQMHNSRPYTLQTVLDLLSQISASPDASLKEKILVRETIGRLTPAAPTAFSGDKKADTVNLLKKGSYVYEHTDKIPLRIEAGASWESCFNTNFNAPDISTIHWFDAYIKGDVAKNFSYNVNAGMGIMKLDVASLTGGFADSHAPNTFTQSWDGYQYLMNNLAEFDGLSNSFAAGIRLLPEFGLRLWDGKAGINFSRTRRDWGTGDGNLVLSGTARPFTALDFYLRPAPWLSLSALTGSLEYFRSEGIKVSAANFQNNISIFMAELFLGKIFYMSLNSSSVWVKRFEPGYMNPGMLPFFYQNMIGDFDNLQMGLAIAFDLPKYARIYCNLFVDEAVLSASDFFHQAGASMIAYQFGSKISVPDTDFMTFLFQYTKIEPYTYTHPLIDVPGYTDKMNTNYLNHGEPIGYKLKPNSSEVKIGIRFLPFHFLRANARYTLVQHGADYGPNGSKVPGSSFGDPMVYGVGASNAQPGDYYYKDFLKDGVYEWIHSLGFSADLNLRFIKDIPLKLSLGYTLSYTHHTEFIDGRFKKARSDEYKNRFGNYVSLSIKVY